MPEDEVDAEVRRLAFAFLDEKVALHGEVLPWAVLSTGFEFRGRRVPLIGPQGIFKPQVLSEMPLSIATAPAREGQPAPYADGMDEQGFLNYRYRGTDRQHRDNVGLRQAMLRRAPLIYLFGVVKGSYMPAYPVYVVGDDADDLCFKVTIDERRLDSDAGELAASAIAEARRSYITVLTLRRLHQRTFSERVFRAYRDACAVCRLNHRELLDAAHILPDGHPRGEPIVPNGLALCKLHHAAFDRHILGIRPDLVIEIRRDILEEVDGPMLKHGLQEMDGAKLRAPRNLSQQPRAEFLEERYQLFRKAS